MRFRSVQLSPPNLEEVDRRTSGLNFKCGKVKAVCQSAGPRRMVQRLLQEGSFRGHYAYHRPLLSWVIHCGTQRTLLQC